MKHEEKIKLAVKPNTSVETLEKLSNGNDFNIRWAVARNPNLPQNIFKKLFKDENKFIRDEVLNNPNCPKILKLLFK